MIVALVALAAHAARSQFGPNDGVLSGLLAEGLYHAIVLVAVASCAARAVLVREARPVWICAAAALGCWFAGSVYYTISGEAAQSTPSFSWADVLFMISFPIAGASLCLLLRKRLRGFDAALLFDGLIMSLAVAAIGAAVVFPLLADATGDSGALSLKLSYLLGELILLTLIAWSLASTGWRPGRVLGWLSAALAIALLGSAVYLIEIATGGYTQGTILDSLWPAAGLMVAYAAWLPDDGTVSTAMPRTHRVFAATGAISVAIALVAYDHFWTLNDVAALLAIATLVALTGRALASFRENRAMVRRAREEAQTDALTGIGNRRKLMGDLTRAIAGATFESPVRLMTYDLDGFKHYNDAYGHLAGDVLLARLGGNLSDAVAPHGCAYRTGGDEFCVLAQGSLSNGALTKLTAAALSERGHGFSITTSSGIVTIPHEALNATVALRTADRRLQANREEANSSATLQARDTLLQVLREREPQLDRHATTVAMLAGAVGRRLRLEASKLDALVRAAELHDIGKMAIPDAILHKPAPLDREEWEFMREHTIVGERILGAARSLQPVARLVRSSHERWDGDGYPDRLVGEQIPLGARIIAACDAFDAMTNERPYREAMLIGEAMVELRRCAGSQFDPRVVEATCAELLAPLEKRNREPADAATAARQVYPSGGSRSAP
jgi:diguanylate cyclase (GGDEF)-like protein